MATVSTNNVPLTSSGFDPWPGVLGGLPVVTLVTSPGSIDATDEVRFDVQGANVFEVVITAEYDDRTEVIFEGDLGLASVAIAPYAMTVTTNGAGFFVDVERTPGWAEDLVLEARAVNGAGVGSDDGTFLISPDLDPPGITFDPAGGTVTVTTPVEITTTTGASAIARVRIIVEFGASTEVAFDGAPGDAAELGYTVTQTPIMGGRTYEVIRDGDWLSDFTLRVEATDGDNTTTEAEAFVLDEPPSAGDAIPPTVGNFVPASGTPIAKTASVRFDVLDNSGNFARIFLVAAFDESGVQEVIHDGDNFAPYYAHSSRVAIAGGFRFTVSRTTGWPSAPRIRIFPLDASGNQA